MADVCRRTNWENARTGATTAYVDVPVVGLSGSLGSILKVFEHVQKQATTT